MVDHCTFLLLIPPFRTTTITIRARAAQGLWPSVRLGSRTKPSLKLLSRVWKTMTLPIWRQMLVAAVPHGQEWRKICLPSDVYIEFLFLFLPLYPSISSQQSFSVAREIPQNCVSFLDSHSHYTRTFFFPGEEKDGHVGKADVVKKWCRDAVVFVSCMLTSLALFPCILHVWQQAKTSGPNFPRKCVGDKRGKSSGGKASRAKESCSKV